MNRLGPQYRALRYPCVCCECGQPFMAGRAEGITCQFAPCQLAHRNRMQRLRAKWRRERLAGDGKG